MAAAKSVFMAGVFINGPEVGQLEAGVAKRAGTAHAVGLNSGTDALLYALMCLGVGPGDEVVTQSNSFIASAAAIAHVGARPVFVDVKPDQTMDPEALEAAITPRTKAIMQVHLTGRICDMVRINVIAASRGIPVVEDAAQAIGSLLHGRPAGSWGSIGAFSAHPLKNFNAAGDAGFLVTDDGAVAERVRRLRNHGLTDRDTASEWGFNSRLDTLQAAILLTRLDRLDSIIAKRRHSAQLYRERLDSAHVYVPPCRNEEFNTFHTFVVQLDRRDELQRYLKDRGIGTKIHYPVPIHLQPAAAELGYAQGSLPITERQAERILSLPIHQYLSADDIDYVAETVNGFYR
ncbi:MAG: DegT/DnrJ/EryC1/StrS family aminotransferase [Proteobacteria bacterium]|nr:DegT/DnrJ/EryC1/StrS family aminotransferase [Pseudomonadota bacterium]